MSEILFRENIISGDAEAIYRLVAATGFFNEEENLVAKELLDERLSKGAASGYEFVVAELDGEVVGYSCYGLIPATDGRYDLYWIAVHPKVQRQQLGSRILKFTEEKIAEKDGHHVYIETSSRPDYVKTRGFYLKNGYDQAALLEDFYRDGDGKVIYVKKF